MIRKRLNARNKFLQAVVLMVILSLLFAQGATSVSARDNLDQAVEAVSFDIISGLANTAPTMDGVISAGEWEDALSYDITKVSTAGLEETEGVESLPQLTTGVVTLYVMNDDDTLYLAIDNTIDTVFSGVDQLGVYFDDNPLPSDGQWTNTTCGHPDGEGSILLINTSVILFQEVVNNGGMVQCGNISPPPGVTGWIGFSSGHAQMELAIDLSTSALRASPGNTVKMYMYTADGINANMQGEWPAGADSYLPSTYGALTLATGYNLQVGKTGTGSGTVTSLPSGINCGTDCSESYVSGTQVKLTATASAGSAFTGWTGACGGVSTTCYVTMSKAKNVTATFATNPPGQYYLSVVKTGSGSIASSPLGITCPTDCGEFYYDGTSILLTATASDGYLFTGWSGACGSTTSFCVVPMSKNKTVTATFLPIPAGKYYLGVKKSGSGKVESFNVPGIDCGTDCNEFYNSTPLLTVRLKATPAVGYSVTWSGACGGTSLNCYVTMSNHKYVKATFSLIAEVEDFMHKVASDPFWRWLGD